MSIFKDDSSGKVSAWSDSLFIRLFQAHCLDIDRWWNSQAVRSSFWRLYINWGEGASVHLPCDKPKYPRRRPRGKPKRNSASPYRKYDISPGKIHLLPAWMTFSCHNTRSIKHLFLHFDLVSAPAPLIRLYFDKPVAIDMDAAAQALADPLAAQLADNPLPPRGGHALGAICQTASAKALIHLALARVFDDADQSDLTKLLGPGLDKEAVGPALRLIEDDLSQPLGVKRMARACFMDKDYFTKRFTGLLNQTPAQYVRHRRMAAAAQRLILTNDSIEQIAEDTGFSNRFYFTRVFTKIMSLAPAAYRKEQLRRSDFGPKDEL